MPDASRLNPRAFFCTLLNRSTSSNIASWLIAKPHLIAAGRAWIVCGRPTDRVDNAKTRVAHTRPQTPHPRPEYPSRRLTQPFGPDALRLPKPRQQMHIDPGPCHIRPPRGTYPRRPIARPTSAHSPGPFLVSTPGSVYVSGEALNVDSRNASSSGFCLGVERLLSDRETRMTTIKGP